MHRAFVAQLYRDSPRYVKTFNQRLDELVGECWFLAEDTGDLQREAQQIEI